jgi:hypothetical protein
MNVGGLERGFALLPVLKAPRETADMKGSVRQNMKPCRDTYVAVARARLARSSGSENANEQFESTKKPSEIIAK